MSTEKFLKDYLADFSKLVLPKNDVVSNLIRVRDSIVAA
ncbi:uncharacterized protein METZ01_LOCUS460787, partial [marine metagenome]